MTEEGREDGGGSLRVLHRRDSCTGASVGRGELPSSLKPLCAEENRQRRELTA